MRQFVDTVRGPLAALAALVAYALLGMAALIPVAVSALIALGRKD